VDYNHNKGHVDGVDQMRQYYGLERRVQRTWPSLAWWLIDMCIVNAYALWSVDTRTHEGQLSFREQLLHQIAAQFPSSLTHVEPTVIPHGGVQRLGHWPKQTGEERDCRVCSKRPAHRVRSEVVCEVCGVHLCIDPCFKRYHEEQHQGN
jgi:hypothetical protein